MLGGPGVDEVTEFAAAGFGARIGRSPAAAASLIGDAQDLVHRLPALWARVQAGQVKASYARHVARQTRALSREEAGYVDQRVVESADGRLPWTRFEALVEGAVAAAAPEAARAREEAASQARFAKKLRTSKDGMASFLIRADVATIEEIDGAVTALAKQLADLPDEALPADVPPMTDDDRRVHACLLLAHPGAEPTTPMCDLLPTVQVYLHCYPGTPDQPDTTEVARMEGHGPLTEAWITRVLGPHARFKVTPVLDLAGQAPVDAYEIPDRHRQAVHLMTPADTFPYATCTSRTMQVDHTIPYDHGGSSGIGNYGPMTGFHHRVKTHGRWQVQQPFPGIYLWRDPHGATYLVDHTGTRPLPRPAPPPRPVLGEIYRPIPKIDYEAA